MAETLSNAPPKRIMVAVPAYRCQAQIGRVIAQFTDAIAEQFCEVMVIDNRSTDATLEAACTAARANPHLPIRVFRNAENYSLGGSHKVAFARCLAQGYDGVVILHGDDQGSIADFADLQADLARDPAGCILGARFHPQARSRGYSGFRILGNHVFNALYSLCTGARVHDMGSGLNYYSRALIARGLHARMPDDLTFNNAMLLATYAAGERVAFKPISWREEDQVSNARLVRQSRRLLALLLRYVFARKSFLTHEFRARPRDSYPSEEIFSTTPDTRHSA